MPKIKNIEQKITWLKRTLSYIRKLRSKEVFADKLHNYYFLCDALNIAIFEKNNKYKDVSADDLFPEFKTELKRLIKSKKYNVTPYGGRFEDQEDGEPFAYWHPSDFINREDFLKDLIKKYKKLNERKD